VNRSTALAAFICTHPRMVDRPHVPSTGHAAGNRTQPRSVCGVRSISLGHITLNFSKSYFELKMKKLLFFEKFAININSFRI